MKNRLFPSTIISRYLIRAVLPYFFFSWTLLSVVLFVQQGGRFADIFFNANIPGTLIWQLTAALIPNVIAFTCPMATLLGVVIGLAKMQSDSELTAIRAAGVGNLQIIMPIALLGLLLSLFAFSVNLFGVPVAAQVVRTVALQAAIKKLESPIEPGVFNTEIAGSTIYVKGGDLDSGSWKNIFIYNQDESSGVVRLITSSDGRIDSSGESAELVLNNAVVSTFQGDITNERFVSEKLGEIRFAIKTRRNELIERLSTSELTPEEMGLAQLAEYASMAEGSDKVESTILWLRRILLAITPLIFSILGAALVLRMTRGGRGAGIALSFAALVAFFLLAFLGEQLARTAAISPLVGSLIPIAASFVAVFLLFKLPKTNITTLVVEKAISLVNSGREVKVRSQKSSFFNDITFGLCDLDLVVNLLKYYVYTIGFLSLIFLVFTAFELWRFAGTMENGMVFLAKYLFYLLPFVYIQLAPSAAMVAILATYVIKSRNNEIVAWISAGQSAYRLLLPCIILMLFLGFINWQFNERIVPQANIVQDQLRDRIRNRGIVKSSLGKYWIANDDRIYSFNLTPEQKAQENQVDTIGNSTGFPFSTSVSELIRSPENKPTENTAKETIKSSASDNELLLNRVCDSGCVVYGLSIYEFEGAGNALKSIYHAEEAVWERDRIVFTGEVDHRTFPGGAKHSDSEIKELFEEINPFLSVRKKPSHLSSSDAKEQIEFTNSDIEKRSFQVAVQKKSSTIFLPLIISLFTAPFSLSLSRSGKVVTVAYAIGLWLLFTGTTGVFEQLGTGGSLPPIIAIWSPLVGFSMLGIYLLSKIKS